MKLLIFSDSHGNTRWMQMALQKNQDADFVLFLGDGWQDADLLRNQYPLPWVCVKGNCDSMLSEYPTEVVFPIAGHKLLMTHGHMRGAKSGVGGLLSGAKETGCDIVLFGHTHHPYERYVGDLTPPVYLFNPGSIGEPHGGVPTFGTLLLDENTVLFSHGSIAWDCET